VNDSVVKKRNIDDEVDDDDDFEDDESEIESVGESPSGPVELESDVEMVDNSELMVLGTSSSSSSSADEATSRRTQHKSGGPTPINRVPITLAVLQGRWSVGGDPPGFWTICDGGISRFNGKLLKNAEKWSFCTEKQQDRALLATEPQIFCPGQRAKGWELDHIMSLPNRLAWRKNGQPFKIWDRVEDFPPQGSPTSTQFASSPPVTSPSPRP